MSLAAAAALAGILLTGCSTEADEKTTTAAETTTAAATEAASGTETEAEKTEGGALAGKKISVMTPYLASVTTNQMAGYIKEDLEAEGAEVFVIDTANDFAELASPDRGCCFFRNRWDRPCKRRSEPGSEPAPGRI